jgi:tetratricopeptide (TPR) repeat protein
MDIDIYQQCPCHAEKKIKFCCGKSVVADLDDAISKNKAGQTSSALEQLERTIAKTGPKDCLLTIQTRLLLQAGEIEKARQSNAKFQANNPEHSSGFHHLALIYAQEGHLLEAVKALQDAMDSIVGNSIPVTYAQAFRTIGMQLLQQQDLFAGRAHLRYADLLKAEQQSGQTLLSTFQNSSSIIAKTEMMPEPCPEGVEWEKKYKNVLRAIDRGQFRKGLKMAKKADATFPGEGVIKRTLAILYGMLGMRADAIVAWQSVAEHAQPGSWEQIDALAIKNYLDQFNARKTDVVRHSYAIDEFDKLKETIASCNVTSPANRPDEDPFGESNPPVAGFYLLSKPKLEADAKEFGLDDVPLMEGEILLYAKQTDRPARLEYIVPKIHSYDQSLDKLKEILGDLYVSPQVSVIDSIPELDATLSWDWLLPEKVSFQRHAELMQQQVRSRLMNTWMNYKFETLNNQSPREAAKNESLRPTLQAILTDLDSNSSSLYPKTVLAEMRKELSIAALDPVDVTDRKVESMSSLLRANVDFSKCPPEKLFQIHEFGVMVRCIPIIERTCHAMLERTDLEGDVNRDRLHAILASTSDQTDVVLDHLANARHEAKAAGRPIGTYLVQEFEFRLSRGLNENLRELIRTIQTRHLEEPEVEYRLTAVLMKFGLYDPTAPENTPSKSPRGNPRAVTPSAASATQKSGSEALWVPE